MEYVILTQSTDAEEGNCCAATRQLGIDVELYLRGGWRPVGGLACGQVNGRFVVMQAMIRERETEPDA